METERLHIVRVEIEYSAYDNVVLYYDLDYVGEDMNAYNLFKHNDPIDVYVQSVSIRLLDDAEWKTYKETGTVDGEAVWKGFPS